MLKRRKQLFMDLINHIMNMKRAAAAIETPCCASFYVRRLGKALNCENFKWNVGYDMVLQTGQLDFYAKVGDMSSAKRVYNEMPRKEIDLSIREKNSVNMEFYHDHLLFQDR
ncbi:pentatricopeptide repeat-containing protein [Tanacetum coccineum]